MNIKPFLFKVKPKTSIIDFEMFTWYMEHHLSEFNNYGIALIEKKYAKIVKILNPKLKFTFIEKYFQGDSTNTIAVNINNNEQEINIFEKNFTSFQKNKFGAIFKTKTSIITFIKR